MEQFGVPSDKIEIAKTHVVSIYITTKNIGKLGEAAGLGFIIRQPRDRKSREDGFKLDKLGKKKRDYIIRKYSDSSKDIIPLLKFKDHWVLYDENNEFNGGKHRNAYRLLRNLIDIGTLREITMKDKSFLETQLATYIEKPHEITLQIMI